MRPLLVNTYDQTGGAARAAYRLHQGLRRLGVESRMLVQSKTGDDPNVIAPTSLAARGLARLRRGLDTLAVRRYPRRVPGTFTPAMVPDRLADTIRALDPDLVHLHWVAAGLVRIESIPRLGRPLVWTLHDSWAFTGGCHVPFDCVRYRDACGCCPALASKRERDLSRAVWDRKRAAWRELDATLVAPSRWLAGCARDSSVLGHLACEVIPNGLDVERFKPMEQGAARDRLGLPQGTTLIAFGGAASVRDPNKGFHLLVEALRDPVLAAPSVGGGPARALEVVVFGDELPEPATRLPHAMRSLGHISGDEELVTLYAAADVFVAPSIQENLPSTVLEAMACGTPCVAFDAGGTADLIDHQVTGWRARPHDPRDLARGIAWVLEDPSRRRSLADRGRRKVVDEFEIGAVARRHQALYRRVLDRATPRA